jgi:glycosyltransferase involved in cell wall biosynthesis
MQVSIVIPIYNQSQFIEKCLGSLWEQNEESFQIIIVDDGSSDKTQRVLSKFKVNPSPTESRRGRETVKLKVFKQKHQGPALARNFGVSKASGKILVFVDGDMYFDKDFLKQLIQPIKFGQAKGTYSTEEYVANWKNCWARCWNYNWNLPDKRRIDFKNVDQQKDFRAILKTEFNKVGGFDNIGYTDTWTLSEKLGYRPQATRAKYYHFNPSTLKEVFQQARWVAKRPYKLGKIGFLLTLVTANPVFSLINGIRKAIRKKEPAFIIFKVVYDLGIIFGLLTKGKYV